jgi:hypothetical protein
MAANPFTTLFTVRAEGAVMNQPVPARGAPIWIETNGYLLRTPQPADITPEVFAWLSSPDMLRGLNLRSLGMDLEGFRRMVAGFDNISNYYIGIYRMGDIGGSPLGFYTVDVNRLHKVGLLTAGMRESDGNGKEVFWATIDALLDHFYAARDIDKISARVLARNHRILFGFMGNSRWVPEMTLKSECLMPDGRRADILVFSSWRGDGRKSIYQPKK